MLFWSKREKHYHRGKNKLSDFPRLLRDWVSELEKNPRSSVGDWKLVLLLYLAMSPAKVILLLVSP